ncbi:MAG: thiolase domain-containing protein [Chloroflexota bacterium]|nr:MAG: thiolase domain-containing protein [Chloroflexota bacterium]
MGWNKVAIVGVGMIRFGELFDKSYDQMIEEAYLAAIEGVDKGITPKEIQAGWYGTARGFLHGQEALGGASLTGSIALAGIPSTRVENGCPTGADTFRNACLGVASGVYDVVLALGAEKMRDKSTTEGLLSRATQGHPIINRGETAPALFTFYAVRHMHEFGTTKEQMALVAVKNHANGALDPYAHHRAAICVEDVYKSPMVAYPFNVLDCCPQTDGAAAIILCRADLAAKYTDKPVYVAGFGLGTDYLHFHEKKTFTEFAATVSAAKQAYAMAGITPSQIDLAEVHDCFSIVELIDYEDLGFCEKGEGGKLVERGETERDGRIPVNVSGGLLSKGHPLGATGLAQLSELYWHLRNEAGERQVEIRRGYGLQHNVGGMGLANAAVTILSNHTN